MIFWTIAIIAFMIIEASTAQFVSIWFAGGSFAALVAAIFEVSIPLQILIFVLVSGLLLIFTKKLVDRLKSPTAIKTNFDALIGQTAVVTEDISNPDGKGAAKLRGIEWSARSADGNKIRQGTYVRVENIDGVKLIVTIKED